MIDHTDHIKLIMLLDWAEMLVGQYSGGYSGQFLSAEEFHHALQESISKFKQGDQSQLNKLHLWCLPTSNWDGFVGKDGEDLGNQITEILSRLTAKNN